MLLISMPFTYSSPDPSFLLLLVKTAFLHPSWGKKWEGWVFCYYFFLVKTQECSNRYFRNTAEETLHDPFHIFKICNSS